MSGAQMWGVLQKQNLLPGDAECLCPDLGGSSQPFQPAHIALNYTASPSPLPPPGCWMQGQRAVTPCTLPSLHQPASPSPHPASTLLYPPAGVCAGDAPQQAEPLAPLLGLLALVRACLPAGRIVPVNLCGQAHVSSLLRCGLLHAELSPTGEPTRAASTQTLMAIETTPTHRAAPLGHACRWQGRAAAALAIANIFYGLINVENVGAGGVAAYTAVFSVIAGSAILLDGWGLCCFTSCCPGGSAPGRCLPCSCPGQQPHPAVAPSWQLAA